LPVKIMLLMACFACEDCIFIFRAGIAPFSNGAGAV
jgi:hypothetical protein